MDLTQELAAIDQQANSNDSKTTTVDNVFLYGMLGLFVLLCIWIVYTLISSNSTPITVLTPPVGSQLPMIASLRDPHQLIPPALPKINQIPSDS